MIATTPIDTRGISLHRANGAPAKVTVPAGGFNRVSYQVSLPSTVPGLWVLASEKLTYGRITIEVVASPKMAGTTSPAQANTEPVVPGNGVPPAVLPENRPLGIILNPAIESAAGGRCPSDR